MNCNSGALMLSFCFTSLVFGGPPAAVPPPPVSGPPARIVVEVIEGTLDPAAALKDLQKIDPKQHRIDKLLSELGKFGPIQLGTRFDGQIMLGKETNFQAGQRYPILTGNNSISYENIGAICNFNQSEPVKGQGYKLGGNVEWSGVGSSNVKISTNVNASTFIRLSMRLSCQVQPDFPLLLSTTMKLPDQPDGQKRIQVVIFRITISPVGE